MKTSSILKVIGCAAVGVGAVAAAPFTGGGSVLGAATLMSSLAGAGVAAAGAGAVGAATGVALSNADEEEIRSAENRGEKNAKNKAETEAQSKYKQQLDKLTVQIKKMLADTAKREQFLVTAFAVGFCAANADGEICDDERAELDVLVAGIGKSDKLSETTRKQVESLYDNPPTLNDVWALIKAHGFNDTEHLELFSFIIESIAEADGETCEKEKDWIAAWHSLAA